MPFLVNVMMSHPMLNLARMGNDSKPLLLKQTAVLLKTKSYIALGIHLCYGRNRGHHLEKLKTT